MLLKKASQALSSPTSTSSLPTRRSSLRITTTSLTTPIRPSYCPTSPEHMEPDSTLEPTVEATIMTSFLETTPVLSQSPLQEEHANFSKFKWNELDEADHDELMTDNDYFCDDDDDDDTNDYIDQYLDDLEIDLDISYALLSDAMATCVAFHSPGKPKLVDITPSPSSTSPEYEISFSTMSGDEQGHHKSNSIASTFSTPSSAAQTSESRSSQDEHESESTYSPLTPRSSSWSLNQPAVLDDNTHNGDTQDLQEQQEPKPMDTPSSAADTLKSPFTPYGAVFAGEGETFHDAKAARRHVLPIQIPPVPKESGFWKQAKAHAKGRKKSISTSWFR